MFQGIPTTGSGLYPKARDLQACPAPAPENLTLPTPKVKVTASLPLARRHFTKVNRLQPALQAVLNTPLPGTVGL